MSHWTTSGPCPTSPGGGKTFLLKAIYAAVRTMEEYRRGDEPRGAAEILADKLHWTFESEKLSDLVAKGSQAPLAFSMTLDGSEFSYQIGKDTTRQIASLVTSPENRESNSIFLPAKEVLSLHHIILKSRELDRSFGFDDIYLDLTRALRQLPTSGKNHAGSAAARKSLEDLIGGRVSLDEATNRWVYKKGNQKYPIGLTSEGVKKIAILDTLLGNRYIRPSSIICIDEPESALHPVAVSQFMDIVAVLAQQGIQFFLASHSYFVVKKLYLIAQEQRLSVPVLSARDGFWEASNLRDGMPNNPIIDESIHLYEQEVGLALG